MSLLIQPEAFDAARDFWEAYLDTVEKNSEPMSDVYEQSIMHAAIFFAQLMIGKPGLRFIAATTSPWESEKQGVPNLCSEAHVGTRTQVASMAKWFIAMMEKQRKAEVADVMNEAILSEGGV